VRPAEREVAPWRNAMVVLLVRTFVVAWQEIIARGSLRGRMALADARLSQSELA
jgi:hypothetical protein